MANNSLFVSSFFFALVLYLTQSFISSYDSPHSMAHFTSFAVAGGSGLLGSEIVAGLLENNAGKVIVLSRHADTKVPSGVEVRVVDFQSVESIASALSGVDVSISALAGVGAGSEPLIAQGAKSAGVKLHVPNEYGIDSRHVPYDAPVGYKRKIRDWLVENKQPALHVAVGALFETFFTPLGGFDFANRQVKFTGSPDVYYSFSTVHDIGTFLGALLTKKPAAEVLALGDVSINSDRLKIGDIAPIYEQSHPGTEIAVTTRSVEEAEAELPTLQGGAYFGGWIRLAWAKGDADLTRGGTVELANGLVPEWKPLSVKEYLAKLD